jgi:hypothetical protein
MSNNNQSKLQISTVLDPTTKYLSTIQSKTAFVCENGIFSVADFTFVG